MILGRSPNLFVGAITAVLNAVVLLGLVQLDAAQLAGLNIAAASLIALIAGTPLTNHQAIADAAATRSQP